MKKIVTATRFSFKDHPVYFAAAVVDFLKGK
jgi:hypothetical protein